MLESWILAWTRADGESAGKPAGGAGATVRDYFAVTSECVMAWTERAMRFCTPTLRINFAT